MKFQAKLKQLDNTLILQTKSRLKGLNDDEVYDIEIKKISTKQARSENQNSYMWKIINQICLKEDGNYNNNYETYNIILQKAGTPYDEYYIKEIALDSFKRRVSHLKEVQRVNINGEPFIYCWVFKGISEMNTAEASKLIEAVKDYASQVGIKFDEDYWNYLIKGETNG